MLYNPADQPPTCIAGVLPIATSTSARPDTPLLPIFAVNFVGTLGFSIVLPFLVFLVTRWGGNALMYGLLGATYSIFQLLGAPLLGRWSDKYGRKRVLLLSQGGTLLSWLIFLLAFVVPVTSLVKPGEPSGFALTLPILVMLVARALDGLTGGNVSVANAYLADVTDESSRSRNYGRMGVAGNLGFMLGPALGGILGATALGEIAPVLAALTISAIALVLIALGLREARPCTLEADPSRATVRKVFGQEPRPCYKVELPEKLGWKRILSLRCIAPLMIVYFLVMLGFNFFYVSFPIHAVTVLHWTVAQTGVYFAVLSVAMTIVQGPVLARLSRSFGDESLIVTGSLILGVGFLMYWVSSTAVAFGGAFLIAVGNGLMWPSVLAALSKRAGKRAQGEVQGVATSLGAVASILGLIVGGVFYGGLGSLVFVVAGAFVIAVVPVTLWVRTQPQTAAAQ